ncbi:hypothetical protein F5B18DRAFT_642751 [Nemania serpens]|nr:hypothetical protein F5B18DRAFT_642751 [Nemania serpens]
MLLFEALQTIILTYLILLIKLSMRDVMTCITIIVPVSAFKSFCPGYIGAVTVQHSNGASFYCDTFPSQALVLVLAR